MMQNVLMQSGIHALITGRQTIFISGITESIDVEGDSCCGYRTINFFINDDLECVEAEGASRPCNRGLDILINDNLEWTDVEGSSCPDER